MLFGIDISKWQKRYKQLNNERNADFVMIKLTEGETYIDPMADKHTWDAYNDDNDVLIGFYHYARPDLHKDPTKEANNFVAAARQKVSEYYDLHNVMLALDFEEWTLSPSESDAWCRKWLDIVADKVGYKPLLYVNASRAGQFARVPEGNYGLWLAKWPNETPTHEGISSVRHYTYKWSVCAMWQYRGAPLDLDVFYGSRDTWRKYALYNMDGANVSTDPEPDGSDTDDVGFAHCGCPVCQALREVIQPNP